MGKVVTWMWNISAIHKRVYHVIRIYEIYCRFHMCGVEDVAPARVVAVSLPAHDETPTR
jgi:hypothetical protein